MLLRRLAGWATGNPLPAATIGGALGYFFIRLGLAEFYAPLGVEPEETGLGYRDVLIRAALGVVLFGIGVGSLVYVAVAEWREQGGRSVRVWIRATLTAVAVLVFTFAIPVSAVQQRRQVLRGESTRDSWAANPLGIRAEAVEVEWLGDRVPKALEDCGKTAQGKPKPCAWVYLGRSGGTVVLFEATADRTVRLPDSELLLVSEP